MDDLITAADHFFSYRQSEIGVVVVWKLKSFSSLKEEFTKSPKFSFQNGDWYLTLYPNGEDNDNTSGYVNLLLTPRLSYYFKIQFRFFVRDASGRCAKLSKVIEKNFKEGNSCGYACFLHRQDLLEGKLGNLLSGDTLTVCCALKTAENYETASSEGFMNPVKEKFVLKIGKDFPPSKLREQFDNGTYSDVVVRVGNETILSHKVILSTQSSVFKAMFESGMRECQENTVDLTNMDETVAKAMLYYMYSREVEGLPAEKTLDLYAAADRYMLTELKEKCRKFLSKNLSSKNVANVFELANLHSDDALVQSALKFFAANVGIILQTNEWKEFSSKNPASSVKLLSHAITS